MALVPAAVAMEGLLRDVDRHMDAVNGDHPVPFVEAHMAAAQAQATSALVHAVRELTEAVKALRPPAQDEPVGMEEL